MCYALNNGSLHHIQQNEAKVEPNSVTLIVMSQGYYAYATSLLNHQE